MSIIRVLSAEIAGRIAAGEVIERPASVVKELVENSIDAGATWIRVQIEQGGQRLIQVTDNGCGMDRQDALMCLEAHATSKMTRDGDVGQIVTLGFRGEAIPSIASVSHFQLQTRRAEDDIGTEIIVDNGIVRDVNDCGCAPGTNIRVGHLFGNLPARRKFLKGPDTEDGHIEEMILMLALSRPDIAFTLSLSGREVIRAAATKDMAARIRMLVGREAFDSMLPVQYEEDGISVRGYVSCPGYTRSSRHEQRLIINGRAAAAETLYFAIRDAYDTLILKGRYPATVLYVDMAPDRVDVNVHPAKREVRFRDSRQVGAVVAAAIRMALRRMPGDIQLETKPFETLQPQSFMPKPVQQVLWREPPQHQLDAPEYARRDARPWTDGAESIPLPPMDNARSVQNAPAGSISNCVAGSQRIPAPAAPADHTGTALAHGDGMPPEHAMPQTDAGSDSAPVVDAMPAETKSPALPGGAPRDGECGLNGSATTDRPPAASGQPLEQGGFRTEAVSTVPPPPARLPSNRMTASAQENMMAVRGRLGERYVLAEVRDGLAVVDIHSAHQRILFEQLLENLKNRKIMRQPLLLPVTLNLSQSDARLMNSQLSSFDSLGFTVEPFGGTTFLLTAVPSGFPCQDLVKTLRDILEDLRQDRNTRAENTLHLAQTTCRHAVSLKDNLTDEEIRHLLAELMKTDMPYADPAGNPTMVHITYSELSKRFGH